ncbi:hypothetical protein F5Y06DRAFT_304790 [Hypoxylon sp. FL0890]|nr:hypothetical protein F5Y06DRAFT_304790 [Hypoxylon sp. FL0890]
MDANRKDVAGPNHGRTSPSLGIGHLGHNDNPPFLATEGNKLPPFLRLPIEIRIMIYEWAVAVEEPIQVKQITRRSNKFVWGKCEKEWRPGMRWILHNLEEQPLAVVSLNRTCRQIYQDLERWPVFYRVNILHFSHPIHLSVFLAAITPQRRKMIRRIQVDLTRNEYSFPHEHPWLRPVRHPLSLLHSLALLSQCKDLRKLSVLLDFRWEYKLKDYLGCTNAQHDIPSPWNLPCFLPHMLLPGRQVFVLGSPIPPQCMSQIRWLPVNMQDTIFQMNRDMLARGHVGQLRHWLRERQWPKWFTDLDTPSIVSEAITAQQLDFPGENRIARDLFQNTVGSISSRTRRKGREFNPSLGILHSEMPKYGAGGELAWQWSDILGIRWNDVFGPEFELRFDQPQGPVTSWEPLRAMWTEGAEYKVRHYYYDLLKGTSPPDILFRQMQGIPSPGLVFESIVDVFSGNLTEAFGTENARCREVAIGKSFNHLEKRWQSRLSKLEKRFGA